MKTIYEDTINEIIINKSRFITILCNVNTKEDIKEKLNTYKNKYKDATHYCYAYITKNQIKCTDDGEPQGTAGMPILSVLTANTLTNTLCIVIRYFGGIKLGAKGLVRAYSNSASNAIKNAKITTLEKGYYIEIKFEYEKTKQIDYVLKDIKINKQYDTLIHYTFKINQNKYQQIENIIIKNATIIKKESILIAV